jgi:hypothetical protein
MINAVDSRALQHDGQITPRNIPAGDLTADDLLANRKRSVVVGEKSHFEEREVCTTYTRSFYELVGDGNPHQNYRISQIADTLGGCPCRSIPGQSQTVKWSYSLGTASGIEGLEFSDLGFNVSESSTQLVTRSYECIDGDYWNSEICT